MGSKCRVICSNCGKKFDVSIGGGFRFHLLHCQHCGKEKSITFDEIGEPHLRYLKGLPGPYSVMSAEHDEYVKKSHPGDPLSWEDYQIIVEGLSGKCSCGGQFTFESTVRCPKCKSSEYVQDPTGYVINYD